LSHKVYRIGHLVSQRRLPYRLYEHHIVAVRQRVAAQIQLPRTGRERGQWHQVLSVSADVDYIVIDRVFVFVGCPLQGTPGHSGRQRKAVVNSALDLSSLFVIVPGHKLERIELIARVVQAVNFDESCQPRVPTSLGHDAVGSPIRQAVIEAFVGGPNSFFLGMGQTTGIEFAQICHAEIVGADNHPRITTLGHRMRETATMLEDESGIRMRGRVYGVPVDGVVQVDVKVGNDRPSVDPHVRR
jgi:hypothetical protein